MDTLSITFFANDFRTVMIFITCVIAYQAMPFKDKRFKYLFGYMLIALIINIVSIATRADGNNIYLSYIQTPLYVSLFTFLLFRKSEKKKSMVVIILVMTIAIVMNFYEAFFMEGGFNQFNSLSNTYINIVLGVLSIRMLISLRFDNQIINLSKEPMFWIAVGIAIGSIGNIINTAFYRLNQGVNNELLIRIVLVSIIVTYLTLILFWIGLWKARNNGKSIPPNLAT